MVLAAVPAQVSLVQFRADDDLSFLDLTGEVGVVLALQLQRVVVVVVLDDEALGATAGVMCSVALIDVVVAGRDAGAAAEQVVLDERCSDASSMESSLPPMA